MGGVDGWMDGLIERVGGIDRCGKKRTPSHKYTISVSSNSASAYSVSLSSNVVLKGFFSSSSSSSASPFASYAPVNFQTNTTKRKKTHPPPPKNLNHIQRLPKIRDLILQAPPPLAQITLHIPILPTSPPSNQPTFTSTLKGKDTERKGHWEEKERTCHIRNRIPKRLQRALRIAIRAPNVLFHIVLFGCWDECGQATSEQRTMNGALGIPRGFFSSETTDLVVIFGFGRR